MRIQTKDTKTIELLRNEKGLIPVIRENLCEDWTFRVYDCKETSRKNYLSPNRREFYKIL